MALLGFMFAFDHMELWDGKAVCLNFFELINQPTSVLLGEAKLTQDKINFLLHQCIKLEICSIMLFARPIKLDKLALCKDLNAYRESQLELCIYMESLIKTT